MSRKTITQELTGGKTKRQRIWDLIRATGGSTFEASEVTPGDIHRETSKCYLESLVRGEYLGCNLIGNSKQYFLINDAGIEAPRVTKQGDKVTQGQGNEALWGAMQALGSFNTRVLAEMAGVMETTVKSYCKMLSCAGYLTVDKKGKGMGSGGIGTQYRLLTSKVNGPRPPMITRLKAVYDPNIHEIVWQQNADHAIEALEDTL
ncbi:hypothetical protein [Nitrosomonas oligotropha]|uniref:hypothetical protein n=1 Tax=Nitrosomonas oligotropha TaxID=42354 RepID=UPI001371C6A8|nr:hypothetical protein [Nitrosomonas oligotropha]MXS82242.1 hypothetical protein [Nitrosomonas oligotropha]